MFIFQNRRVLPIKKDGTYLLITSVRDISSSDGGTFSIEIRGPDPSGRGRGSYLSAADYPLLLVRIFMFFIIQTGSKVFRLFGSS